MIGMGEKPRNAMKRKRRKTKIPRSSTKAGKNNGDGEDLGD